MSAVALAPCAPQVAVQVAALAGMYSPEPPRVPLSKARQQARLALRIDKDAPTHANIIFCHPERGGARVCAYIDREMHILSGGWFALEPGERLAELRNFGVQLQVSGRRKGGVKFRGVPRGASIVKSKFGRVIAWRGAPDDWRSLHMRFEQELT